MHLEAIFLKKKKTNGVMPKSNVNNCSQLVRIFALSSCAFLLSDHTQFCSQTVRNFALRPYAILLSDRTQFCSRTVRNFALGPYAILLSDRCSYSFLLSNRCSYPRPTGPPYKSDVLISYTPPIMHPLHPAKPTMEQPLLSDTRKKKSSLYKQAMENWRGTRQAL